MSVYTIQNIYIINVIFLKTIIASLDLTEKIMFII